MKVLNLRCADGHGFEGWFASEEDFLQQNGRSSIECPMCANRVISRMPTAPRLNLGASRGSVESPSPAPAETAGPGSGMQAALPADLQAAWLKTVRHLMDNTEDVGHQFAEKARRIHYGEEPNRGIRGQASLQEREALREEGIETLSIPLPVAHKGPLQ
jgi:hypothetical protein